MDGVAKDLARIREFVDQGRARAAIALFVDEGGYFRNRPAPVGSAWRDWAGAGPGGSDVSVLWSLFPPS
jgi:hypothetical protein